MAKGMSGETGMSARDLAARVAAVLDGKKGELIVLLDVEGVSTLCDWVVVVSGSSPPHLKAMSGAVQQELKALGVFSYRRTGTPESGWMIVDYVDVVIHILDRGKRDYYAIEDLWPEAPRPDWRSPAP